MKLFLIEVQFEPNGNWTPVDVISAENAKAAMIEADQRYSKFGHAREVNPMADLITQRRLKDQGLKICPGGTDCPHGEHRPHLAKIVEV